MGRFHDPRLQEFKEQKRKEEQARLLKEAEERKRIEAEIEALKPKSTKSNDPWAGIAALNESRNAMYAQAGGVKKFYKLPKSEQKKVQNKFEAEQEKQNKAKEAKIAALQKKLDAYPKPSNSESSQFSGGILGDLKRIKNNLKEREYEKEYFAMRSKENTQMVNNVVNSNPEKFSVKTKKDKNGNVIEHIITNKENQIKMNEALAKAKTPAEKEKIKKKYKDLITYPIRDPLYGYTSVHGSNPQWSNGNERAQLGPVVLDRMLQGKPGYVNGSGDATLKTVGLGARPTTGNNNFFGSIGGFVDGALGKVAKVTDKLLKPITKPLAKPVTSTLKAVTKQGDILTSLAKGDIEGAAKAGLDVVNLGKEAIIETGKASISGATAPSRLIGEATGIKPLEDVSRNVEREAQKGTETYGRTAIDIGANIGTGGAYGAGMSLAGGLAEGGIGSLVSPENIAKYGVDAAASYAGVDPNMLKAGLAASKGDLKGAALQSAGSLGGFDPEMIKAGLEGDITGAGLAFAGVDEKTGKALLRGDLGEAAGAGLTAGLTGAAAMYGGEMASEAGIDPETFQKAVDISNSALKGDLKQQALQKLSGAAGLSPEQTSILQAATSGNLKEELTNRAGQAAGLTNEQIQVGRTIASGDTKGITNMAVQKGAEYTIGRGDSLSKIAKKYGMTVDQLVKANPQIKDINKIAAGAKLNIPQPIQSAVSGATTVADKFMKDAQGRTIYGANNAPILNPDYESVAADARQLQKIKDYTPAAGETVQQYADRMGLDPNVILEQNKGKGLSLGKPIPRGVDVALPKGFQLPEKEEPGFFSKMGDKVSGAWESITGGDKKAPAKGKEDKGFFDRATDFISDNKSGIIGGIAQGGSALLGYKAGQEAREDVEKLTKQQLADLQRQGKEFMEVSYDPERYKQERAFLQERIAKGGITKEEEALQKQGDIRAARAAAAARLAGVEQQARLGGAAMGTSALASSLAGSQALLGEQSQTNLAREQAAAKNLESAIQRRGSLSTQETGERAELARQQGTFGLDRTTRIGGVRGDLGNLAFDEAAAKQRLYGTGADLITRGANTLFPSQEQPTQNLQTRAGAAQTIVNKPPSNKRQTTTQTTNKDTLAPSGQQLNARNLTAGVKPADALKDPKAAGTQIVNNAAEIAKQKAKQEADRLKKEAEKKAKETVGSIVPGPLKGMLGF